MRKSRLLVLALALAMVFALALTGCNGDNDTNGDDPVTGDERSGGTFRMYINEPQFIDPYNAGESEGLHVVHAIFMPLIYPSHQDPTVIEYGAATSFEVNDDATVFTFELDPAARFANDTPVTADDFIFAFNRIANPNTENTMTGEVDPSTIASQLSAVKGFDAVQEGNADTLEGLVALDDHTLEITLDEPFGDFIQNVMHASLVPVPQDLVENGVPFDGGTVPFGEMPIGNGPFMMSEPWSPGQSIETVRNPYFSGDPAYVDGVSFRIFADVDAAFVDWQAGNLDLAEISSGQLIAMEEQYGVAGNDGYTANPGNQVINGAQAGTYFILVNNTEEAAHLDNPDVRRALTLAINRDAINDLVWESSYQVATDVLPPGIPGFEEGAWEDSRFDREAAEQALVDAGFPGGEGLPTLTLSLNAGAGHEPILELIQSDLAEIGITANLDGMEWATYLDALDDKNYEIGRLGWMASYPSTDYFLYELFSTDNPNNFVGFSSPEVDEMLMEARTIADSEDRAEKYREINALIQAENPLIPIAFYAHRMIASDRMNDLTISSLNNVDFRRLWITADQQ
ncbi:MAG: peptide ABC transporter substrate-binding protein [Coriobacteriia bacterium]|nr:peptide ABC transporter substrate-binding protein [Coriobacteriia bacterium]